jgi:radical SAM superfamily enzyme with C-terminal helix-hairpin-helix motif
MVLHCIKAMSPTAIRTVDTCSSLGISGMKIISKYTSALGNLILTAQTARGSNAYRRTKYSACTTLIYSNDLE